MTDEAWNSLQESWHRKNMNKLQAEYFMSKVKINRITCQYVDTQETEQLNNTEKEN